jgi:uncharacterized protein (DUF2062 family)
MNDSPGHRTGTWIRGGIIVSHLWRKTRRFLIVKVLHADDTPHRIALGIAIGVFIGFTPTVGLQMIIALALATLLRANKVVCLPMVWVSNPVTMVPIYLVCFQVGSALVGSQSATPGQHPVKAIQILGAVPGEGGWGKWLEPAFWRELLLTMTRVGAELWIGAIVLGLPAAALSYFVSRKIVFSYRERRARLKALRLEQRLKRQKKFVKGLRSRRRSFEA